MKDLKQRTITATDTLKAAHPHLMGGKGLTTVPDIVAQAAGPDKKPGLGPDYENLPTLATPSELNVTILKGDDSQLYYLFEARGRRFVRSSKLVIEQRQKVWGDLGQLSILAASADDKKKVNEQIENPKKSENALVATRVGYERTKIPRYFVYGDGTVITPHNDLQVISVVGNSNRVSSSGNLDLYETEIAKIIRDQSVPITLFFFGLSSVVKPFVSGNGHKAENFMFELVGRSSTYKSALTCTLAASAWGKGHTSDGYARDWNMSEQKIEELLLDFNEHLLILDEATLAHPREKERAEKILNTVHRLSSGQGRARTGTDSLSHSVSMMSTSNQPMHLILPASDEVRRALEVRLISFQLPTTKSSFFDVAPEGFSTIDDAMQHLFRITADNYGLLAKAYINTVLEALNKDPNEISAVLNSAISKFLKKADLKQSNSDKDISFRRVQPFALSYAIAVLGIHLGLLKKKKWGHVKRTILRAWNNYGAPQPAILDHPRIVAYMNDAENSFVDARVGSKPTISDKEFLKVAGFIFLGKDKKLHLAIPAGRSKNLGISSAVMKNLKAEGVLRAGEKDLQTKRVLRISGQDEKRDAFYIFRIHQIPEEVAFYKRNKTN
ncbi:MULTISPECIES: DUF927 domain-containing protein [unclassified Rhizobium]|uniref:DUF927 domain-containing protein n=1 Tax=unclassified Rhizobium TaxID=2613769 RepID=UPI00178178DB|nr:MULTISPECIES: DUF927 domain-containing protein [unclassified Rhizobium]MBD8685997.1 DUF927 domain-containing protein [Rhizobium sp. CFBP 13644]MBD8690330.1 DUF927 domain-containing protein [Rhizobium sp. CFBP 13717]